MTRIDRYNVLSVGAGCCLIDKPGTSERSGTEQAPSGKIVNLDLDDAPEGDLSPRVTWKSHRFIDHEPAFFTCTDLGALQIGQSRLTPVHEFNVLDRFGCMRCAVNRCPSLTVLVEVQEST